MEKPSLFHDLTDIYEALIDWPKRLAHEEPFYRHWFDRFGVRSVVDVACGTGRHVAMFHQWGLRVEGADVSSAMIARSQSQHGQTENLRWVVRGFDEPVEPEIPFDAAICVGNSLALAPDQKTVEGAWRQIFQAVRPGGLVIVQVLNLCRLPDGPCVWQKCRRMQTIHGEMVVVKGVHRSGMRGYVDLIVADVHTGSLQHSESLPLLGWESADWKRMAEDAGAARTWVLGGYDSQSYRRGESVDLILVAERVAQ